MPPVHIPNWWKPAYDPYFLFALALISRLIVWPFSDVVDADAVSRTLIGETYLEYPGWAGDGVWPPLHMYLSGLSTLVCGGRQVGSVLVNILLGSALVFPVHAIARRLSTTVVANAVTVLVVFNTLVFRNSLQGLSEIPFLFFTACAFNSVSIAMQDTSRVGTRHAVLGGVFITLACGMRYEAWGLAVLLTVMLMVVRSWTRSLLFLVPALVFPVAWMITGQQHHGNMFSGLEQVVHWRTSAPIAHVTDNELRLRTLFFPVSILMTVSPLAVVLGLTGVCAVFIRRTGTPHWIWFTLFPVFLCIMVLKARHAELLLQHRFTMTLGLLFIPFLITGFAMVRSRLGTTLLVIAICVSSLMASRVYSGPWWSVMSTPGSATEAACIHIRMNALDELAPVPTLNTDLPDRVLRVVNAHYADRRLLVLDFFGWQQTYNVAFRSMVRPSSIVFLPDGTDPHQGLSRLNDYLSHISGFDGLLLLVNDHGYQQALPSAPDGQLLLVLATKRLLLSKLDVVDNITLYRFVVTDTKTIDHATPLPAPSSVVAAGSR